MVRSAAPCRRHHFKETGARALAACTTRSGDDYFALRDEEAGVGGGIGDDGSNAQKGKNKESVVS